MCSIQEKASQMMDKASENAQSAKNSMQEVLFCSVFSINWMCKFVTCMVLRHELVSLLHMNFLHKIDPKLLVMIILFCVDWSANQGQGTRSS